MENEETTEDLELEEQDETGEEEVTPEEETIQTPVKLTYEQKLANATTDAEKFAIANAEAAKNRRLLGKARNPAAPTQRTVQQPTRETSSADIEETVLKAQGMDDELLTKLKKIAALNGTSLLDAQKDELFVAAKNQYEKELTSKSAAMPPSRGSGSPKPKVNLTTPGLTREQHKALLRG